MEYVRDISSLEVMIAFGESIGKQLRGGEVLELSGDVGTGKTTFTKGVAKGLLINEVVQSPTFTISRVYQARNNLQLFHYDFYRLKEAGIMREELAESLKDPLAVIVLEWDETVSDLLPDERTMRLEIAYTDEQERQVKISMPKPLDYVLPKEGKAS